MTYDLQTESKTGVMPHYHMQSCNGFIFLKLFHHINRSSIYFLQVCLFSPDSVLNAVSGQLCSTV